MRNPTGEPIDEAEPLWRYFKTENFIDCISTGELYFASASQFDDPFEGATAVLPPHIHVDPRYPIQGEMGERAFEALRRLTKVNCWHRSAFESHAMWQLYAAASKGVAVRTTPTRLRDAVSPFRLQPNHGAEDIWAGNVVYVDLLAERLRPSSIARFWHKHMVFSWEREFRMGISLANAEEFGVAVPTEGVRVAFNMTDLIDKIVLGPLLTPQERESILRAMSRAELEDKIQESSMLGTPRYT